MFGIIRPCRNRLGADLRRDWMAHLCGLCLTLRDEHGHAARFVTNYDAIAVSALVDAQLPAAGRRQTGPCALRGMRPAAVAEGDGARLAASVSLLLASAKLHDHVADGDLTGLRARVAGRAATRLATAGNRTGADLALDTGALLTAAAGQAEAERQPRSLLEVTAPTEAASALAFRHTAVVTGQPGNEAPLAEAGRLFGRLAHLLDAVEDLHDDRARGVWNPIDALGLSPDEVRRHCEDAALGVRLALRDTDFVDDRLVHVLLAHELDAAVRRAFTRAGQPGPPPLTPPLPPDQQPPPQRPNWEAPPPEKQKGPIAACLASIVACGTCQACRAQNQPDEEQKESACSKFCDGCDCCCDGCDGCGDCCDCCSCCDC